VAVGTQSQRIRLRSLAIPPSRTPNVGSSPPPFRILAVRENDEKKGCWFAGSCLAVFAFLLLAALYQTLIRN
jgi:hypothetical protein